MGDSRVSGITEADSSGRRDRLSELPDSLIFVILSLMPTRDVVMTTFLSKRWKDLWTTIPYLDFRNTPTDNNNDMVNFRSFVCRVLSLWQGAKILILKFSINNFRFLHSISSDLDSWLLFAIEKQVEELHVNLKKSQINSEREYYAPQRLSSCSSIRILRLACCNLEFDKNVQWNQLNSLTIDGVDSFCEAALNKIIAGAPNLEVLNLTVLDNNGKNWDIRSTSLKVFKIMVDSHLPICSKAKLRIWAPNLETLEISGFMYDRCLLNVPFLTNAILLFHDIHLHPLEGNVFVEEMLMKLFQSICHVEKVTLSTEWCIQVLSEMKKKDMFIPFSNVKSLKLYARAAMDILAVLEMFPELMFLVVERYDLTGVMAEDEMICHLYEFYRMDVNLGPRDPDIIKFDSCNSSELRANFPSLSLLHLRTVEITWYLSETSIIPVIEILLENAAMLVKMMFWPRSFEALPKSHSLAEEKVLSLPRSSPTAEVIVIKEN